MKTISSDVIFGRNVKTYNYVNLYGCKIGDNTTIGTFVEIQKDAAVGSNCKISSHSFICEGVVIEDNVFVGHNVTFTNDLYPRATNKDGKLQTQEDLGVPDPNPDGSWVAIGVHYHSGSYSAQLKLISPELPAVQPAMLC